MIVNLLEGKSVQIVDALIIVERRELKKWEQNNDNYTTNSHYMVFN
jgi:hypothetical protein